MVFRPSLGEVLRWAESLEALLTNQCKTSCPRRDVSSFVDESPVRFIVYTSGLSRCSWSDGLAVFRHFLRSEFSEENLDFWLAVETFKRTRPFSKMAARAETIFNEFISSSAVRQVTFLSSCPLTALKAPRVTTAVLSPGQRGLVRQGVDQSEPAFWG